MAWCDKHECPEMACGCDDPALTSEVNRLESLSDKFVKPLRLPEKFCIWVAWKLPKRIVYWCFIRVSSGNGAGGPYSGNPSERTCGDAARAFFLGK